MQTIGRSSFAMPSLIAIVAVLFGASIALAAPLTDGIGQQPNAAVEKRATGTQTGLATATPGGGEYITPIFIEGVLKRVLLDTGSVDLWIKGNGTAVNGPSFTTGYTGGSRVAGNWTTGNVTVGGITLTDQPYGVAQTWDGHSSYDGVLGISALRAQFRGAAPSWLSNVMPQLAQPVFAVNLAREGGTIALGYTEAAHEAAPPAYFPNSTPNVSWHLNITSFGVPTGDTSFNCLLDTGTTDVYVPQSVAEAYWSQVQGATKYGTGKWEFPCSSTLPDFVPQIGSHVLTVPGSANVLRSGGKCYARLQGSSSKCVFGQSFLFGQYTIFDWANQQIGLSDRK